ncbi:MAG: phosphatase [Chloroflexota bacterium]|nr:phosphatase [Chloroflexota bacterium]
MTATRHSRQEIEERLADQKLSGANLAHSRANNLAHVRRLVNADQGVTLGIDLVHQHLEHAPMEAEHVLQLIASITGCSSDIHYEDGFGYISPAATYDGLRAAATAMRDAIEQRASLIFASGHPKNMAAAYEQLAAYAAAQGCPVINEDPSGIEEYFGQRLELRGHVYLVTDRGEPAHTHRHEYMRDLLRRTPPVGLMIADHGFAGAALNLGIPTICVMDTNDPGVALAATLGAPVTVVPLNDNSPGEVVCEIADILMAMIEGSLP